MILVVCVKYVTFVMQVHYRGEGGKWNVPITVVILIGLFIIRWHGTEKVGFFCPVMEVWFLAIAIAGGAVITAHPQILAALDPRASGFITHHELGGA